MFEEVGTNLLAFINEIDDSSLATFVFLAHNGAFDQRMLEQEFKRSKLILPKNWIFGDSEGILKRFIPKGIAITGYSLPHLVTTFLPGEKILHEAQSDVKHLWQIICLLIKDPLIQIPNIVQQKINGGSKHPLIVEDNNTKKKQRLMKDFQ